MCICGSTSLFRMIDSSIGNRKRRIGFWSDSWQWNWAIFRKIKWSGTIVDKV